MAFQIQVVISRNSNTAISITLLILFQLTSIVHCKKQYVQPLNSGLNMAVKYDIANIFIRPIAAYTSVILTVALGAILFFGVITAPFGYFFGIPSRKYVMGGLNVTDTRRADQNPKVSKLQMLHMQPRGLFMMDNEFGQADSVVEAKLWPDSKYPNFTQSMFRLFPTDENLENDVPCSLLLTCYAHGAIQYLPNTLVRLYKLFSKNLSEIPSEHKRAILIGLQNNHYQLCDNMYKDCRKSVMTIVVKTLTSWLPQRARRKTKCSNYNNPF